MASENIGAALARHKDLVEAGQNDAALAVLRQARDEHGFNVALD